MIAAARASVCSLMAFAACAPSTPSHRFWPSALPQTEEGADRLGIAIAERLPERRIGPEAHVADRVALVRWWTDGCPHCVQSLPEIERLRREYADRGLVTLAVYHPKPPREVDDAEIAATAQRLGYHGPLAVDPTWSVLRSLWLDTRNREATSVTFVLDRAGRVRFVHPGPEFHRSDDPDHARCDADAREVEQAVRALLAEAD